MSREVYENAVAFAPGARGSACVTQGLDAARQTRDHIKLAAVIGADVGIGGPEQGRVDSAVLLLEAVKPGLWGVLSQGLVVEEAIKGHHQGLHVGRLRPRQGPFKDRRVEVELSPAALPPRLHARSPLRGRVGVRGGWALTANTPTGA